MKRRNMEGFIKLKVKPQLLNSAGLLYGNCDFHPDQISFHILCHET